MVGNTEVNQNENPRVVIGSRHDGTIRGSELEMRGYLGVSDDGTGPVYAGLA